MSFLKTDSNTRIRMRRMSRIEFQNTLQDLLALPRLDMIGLLPADGRVAGYDKMAGALDISPVAGTKANWSLERLRLPCSGRMRRENNQRAADC